MPSHLYGSLSTGNDTIVPSGSGISSRKRKQHVYRGIRYRNGKWVTEIRVPKKNKRIWLGTYPTPVMAATAHDVAALALKGREALLNFPDSAQFYPLPCSNSDAHIKTAATAAAAAVAPAAIAIGEVTGDEKNEDGVCDAVGYSTREFLEEEENMHTLIVDLERAMMVDPPSMGFSPLDDLLENFSGENLWSY